MAQQEIQVLEIGMPGPAGSGVTAGQLTAITDDITALEAADALNVQVTFVAGSTTDPVGVPDASSTVTSTYAVAFATTWVLPAGTWEIKGMAFCSFIHSGSAPVDFYGEIGGSGTLSHTPNLSSTIYSQWVDQVSKTGQVSDGSTPIDVKIRYRPNTVGTATPQGPKIFLVATRTA